MGEINTLLDIYEKTRNEVIERFEHNITAVFLYGSFAYRDLQTPTNTFKELHGKQGLLDKKPDFVVIVPDIEDAIKTIAKTLSYSKTTTDKLLRLRQDSPYYFNVKTEHAFDLELEKKQEIAAIPYKLGIVKQDAFFTPPGHKHNIYLSSRLSKFFNISYQNGRQPKIKNQIDTIRDYFITLAIKTLPKKFSGEGFVKRYLLVTYLAEIYRVFDLTKSKHLQIFEGKAYDLEKRQLDDMKTTLEQMLVPALEKREDIARLSDESNFYDATFITSNNKSLKVYIDMLFYNLVSANITLRKNRITSNTNNLDYILRKFK